MNKLPRSRYENIVVKNLKDEVLIYDLIIDKAYTLNETSAIIWNLCDGKTSVAQIAKQLSKKLNMRVSDEIVWLALDCFKKDNLLVDSENFEIEYNGLSRRQVIRQVGSASMIALPTVFSLIAPPAAHAGSGTGAQANGTPCTNPSVCSSGICTTTKDRTGGAGVPNGTRCCYATAAPPNGMGALLVSPSGGAPGVVVTTEATCTNNALQCCSGNSSFAPVGDGSRGNCTCI